MGRVNQQRTLPIYVYYFINEGHESFDDRVDYITEFKIENENRPNKKIVYPIALFLLLVFGYLNKRRTN